MENQNSKRTPLPKYIHALVIVAIMILFSFLPTFGTVTRNGMQVLGILAAVVYGMSTIDVFWPSLAALLGLGLVTGDMVGVLTRSLGTNLVWGMIMVFIILYAMEKENVTGFFSNWIIRRKILKGRPWLFSFAILLGVCIVSVVSPEAAMLLFWEIIYGTCDTVGIKRDSRWSVAMIFGTCLSAGMGVLLLPIMRNGLIVSNIYAAVTKAPIDNLKYIITMIPLAVLSIALFILICKFVFRIDVSFLKNIDNLGSVKEEMKLNTRQKFVIAGVFIMVLLLLIPSVLPKAWLITTWINNIGLFGVSSILVLVLCIAKIGGQPMLRIQEAASKGVIWPMVMMVALIVPIGAALTNKDAGITAWISEGLTPLLAGKSPWMFVLVLVVIGAVLTNFAQNLVIFSLMMPIMFALASTTNINMPAVAILLAVATHYAMILPSASPSAGMMFSNINFKPFFAYKQGMVVMIACLVFIMTIGYLWLNLIF